MKSIPQSLAHPPSRIAEVQGGRAFVAAGKALLGESLYFASRLSGAEDAPKQQYADPDELLRFIDYTEKVHKKERHLLIAFVENLFRLPKGGPMDLWDVDCPEP
mgnify:CR=1 FL=1